ncbi:hypothetical protein BJ741DRAFT_621262 [Chytriomyces cf. hyalinus JEL632]|nr:hypothetical protein BJ741DRAFT_621262 [Chytriomyces cf. hyalinus JEL632]
MDLLSLTQLRDSIVYNDGIEASESSGASTTTSMKDFTLVIRSTPMELLAKLMNTSLELIETVFSPRNCCITHEKVPAEKLSENAHSSSDDTLTIDWTVLSAWHLSYTRSRDFAAISDTNQQPIVFQRALAHKLMCIKMRHAQVLLIVLLECLRRLSNEPCSLPNIAIVPKLEDASEVRPISSSFSSRYARRPKKTSKKQCAEKSETSTVEEYSRTLFIVFDRILIWDSIHFLNLEQDDDAVVGAHFKAFMNDCVASFLTEVKDTAAVLFKKANLTLPDAVTRGQPSKTTSVSSASDTLPIQTQKESLLSHTRRVTRSSSSNLAAPTLIPATASHLPPISSSQNSTSSSTSTFTNPRSDSTPSIASTSSTFSSMMSSASFSINPNVAVPMKRSRSSLASLSTRVVSFAPKNKLSASEKARQILAKKMKLENANDRAIAEPRQKRQAGQSPAKLLPSNKQFQDPSRMLDLSAQAKVDQNTNKLAAKLKEREQQALKKASELMAKRMSGGNGGMVMGSFSTAGCVSGLTRIKSAEEMRKEKLKKDLQLTERLRGPAVILKPARNNSKSNSIEHEFPKSPTRRRSVLTPSKQIAMTTTPTKMIRRASITAAHRTPTPGKISKAMVAPMSKTKSPSSSLAQPSLELATTTQTDFQNEVPKTPSSQRKTRISKLALPLLNSGRKLAAEFKSIDWDEVEQSCGGIELSLPVSDSPIKDVLDARPAVKLKVRSAKKRMASRLLDVESLFM